MDVEEAKYTKLGFVPTYQTFFQQTFSPVHLYSTTPVYYNDLIPLLFVTQNQIILLLSLVPLKVSFFSSSPPATVAFGLLIMDVNLYADFCTAAL